MSSFPCLVRFVSGSGQARYRLGDRLVDRYLEFVAGGCRPNTLRAVAFDLKAFFTVIGKDPVAVTAADVFEFLADQRGDRTVVRLADRESGLSARTMARRLGREPVVLPAPLDALILKLTASRHGHAAIGDQGTSPWLFPGGQPSRPISAFHLAERLRQLGVRPGQSRSAALFQLATDLPAAVLARMPGIHITVAVAWQRASAGDRAACAAEISRRKETGNDTQRETAGP
jgi:hypothetical protein